MKTVKSLGEIVKQLRSCGYTCEAGPLENNVDFQTLERIAGVSPEKSLKEMVDEVSEIMMQDPFILPKSPQQIRDEIVAKAKADVEALIYDVGSCALSQTATFYVNRNKRAVTALMYRDYDGVLKSKGIAKADPSDCFNVQIGKAIALRRALGLEVPAEYYNAPAPTEVRVGDVVKFAAGTVREIVKVEGGYMHYPNGFCNSLRLFGIDAVKIIDDSRE